MSKLSEALDRIEELEAQIASGLSAVEQDGAHIVIDWREFPGLRVGLDAAGNAVRVEFDPAVDAWVGE